MAVWVQLAAGSGVRAESAIPKQFRRLGRKPLLAYAIETFLSVFPEAPVVVVLPLAYFTYGKALLQRYFPKAQLLFTIGGATRSASTEAALAFLCEAALLQPQEVIAFHDAVRPFPSAALIARAFATAQQKGSAVCGLPLSFSIRQVEGESSRALPRESFWEVQTPQVFRGDVLQAAWQKLSPTADPRFTDESSWIEAAGWPIYLIPGEPTNIKITYPIDWEVARGWLRRKSTS
ncbi:MAG: 2-C-methyl-D-erythritol 4-phosphate cytidylyltransferase [Bacteroidia bacterium]|nr:2-C-methyl-D-erythritol 4-phosphate cytidylyltransferase [Bacteroidia bacterium]MDW8088194.1 IspD/TarI family cytidylyltransferase [Bacteroidia bacterium]